MDMNRKMAAAAVETASPSDTKSHHSSYRLDTLCVHAGTSPHPITGAVTTTISLSSTFAQKSPGVHHGFEYSRSGNPSRQALETAIAALEGAKYGQSFLSHSLTSHYLICCGVVWNEIAFAFSTGSAATSSLIHLLKSGDHIICIDDVFGGTNRFLKSVCHNQPPACLHWRTALSIATVY